MPQMLKLMFLMLNQKKTASVKPVRRMLIVALKGLSVSMVSVEPPAILMKIVQKVIISVRMQMEYLSVFLSQDFVQAHLSVQI